MGLVGVSGGLVEGQWGAKGTSTMPQSLCGRAFPAILVEGASKKYFLFVNVVFQNGPIGLSFFDLYIESQVTCLGGSDSPPDLG